MTSREFNRLEDALDALSEIEDSLDAIDITDWGLDCDSNPDLEKPLALAQDNFSRFIRELKKIYNIEKEKPDSY